MRRSLIAQLASLSLVLASSAALACGQVGLCEPSEPGGKTTIRGYGYGFEGGDRPVNLVWTEGGTVAGKAQINSDGDFQVEITVPDTPGNHNLLVLTGDADPSPVSVTIAVVVPPPYRRLMNWTYSALPSPSTSWTIGLLGFLLAALVSGLAADSRRRYSPNFPA
jgi:hypothetical protein